MSQPPHAGDAAQSRPKGGDERTDGERMALNLFCLLQVRQSCASSMRLFRLRADGSFAALPSERMEWIPKNRFGSAQTSALFCGN